MLGAVPGLPGAYGDVQYHNDYEPTGGLMLLRLEAPLFYAKADLVRDRIKRLVGGAAITPWAVVLDVGANGDLDITSAEMLTRLVGTLRGAGVDLALAEARASVLRRAQAAGVLDTLGEDHVVGVAAAAEPSLSGEVERRPRRVLRGGVSRRWSGGVGRGRGGAGGSCRP